ncbi:MAG: heparan-alpha-glucosaminide N-acetyltransferase [Paracoccaceae bacterium]
MPPTARNRLVLIDIARSLALAGMLAFHIRFDLVLFGLADPAIAASPLFYWHARIVAGSFMVLAGLSLWLAHGGGLDRRAFWRREGRLVAAAALVSGATYLVLPSAWIFFGILHSIALGSVLALPFLRLPAALTLGAGALVIGAAQVLPGVLRWNHPALRWLGLQDIGTASADLEPLFPWFGLILIGLGAGRALAPLWPRLVWRESRALTALAWPGRHSLILYLVHQPVLLALIWTWTRLG